MASGYILQPGLALALTGLLLGYHPGCEDEVWEWISQGGSMGVCLGWRTGYQGIAQIEHLPRGDFEKHRSFVLRGGTLV